MPKTKFTNKKFYNKWCYKLSLYSRGVSVFRYFNESDLYKFLSVNDDKNYRGFLFSDAASNKQELTRIFNSIEKLEKDSYAKRLERNQIDLYCNDKSIFENLKLELYDLIIKQVEPSSLLKDNDSEKISVKKLPHDKFKYKVYLKPHKLKKDQDAKKKFLDWLDSQSPRISISHSVKRWFMITDWNWDRRYMWVEDESTLLMLKLRNTDICGKVLEYQLCDK